MSRKKHSRLPQVEAVERKLLLSTGAVALPQASAIVMQSTAKHHVALNGWVSGSWSSQPVIPDVGSMQTLTGSGKITPLGSVDATGTLRSPGFIAKGHAGGTLTLTNAHGSVTISLKGPLQRGFSSLPNKFSFQITSGTGAYAGDTGRGMAQLSEVLNDSSTPTVGQPIMNFRVTLNSK